MYAFGKPERLIEDRAYESALLDAAPRLKSLIYEQALS
jgi:hypothetical protein